MLRQAFDPAVIAELAAEVKCRMKPKPQKLTLANNRIGFGVWGLGFRVWGLGSGVWGLGCDIGTLIIGIGFGCHSSIIIKGP